MRGSIDAEGATRDREPAGVGEMGAQLARDSFPVGGGRAGTDN